MTIIGRIYEIFDEVVKANDFKIREFVIETSESSTHPQHVKFILLKEKTDLIDEVKKDELVTISFNVKGKKWVNTQGVVSYTNSLECWKIERMNSYNPRREKNESEGYGF